ncbi:MAG: arylsulfatase [Puia sp.]|nr:arylsulfatase [Puia sp.]
MRTKILFAAAVIATGWAPLSVFAQYDPVRKFEGKIGKTIETTQQSWTERVRAPKGAPNVLWILIDDVGFGASSSFGGLIQTPNFDSLANDGIRYTNFHTTGICSPTRAALLTGRNSHSVAMGHHAELGIGTPGYSGDIPFEAGTVAEIFKENGYNTFALGKWHSTHPKDVTAAGPYNRWPTGRGFEHFYGFIGGLTDQWHPQLIEENNPVDIEPNTRHLNELLTDKAISYIANQKSADPDKPFFLYFAPGATHAPHHVPADWINKYKGQFDGGWDRYREEVFRRQQALGLLPKGAALPSRQTGVKAWESLGADEKKVFARFMEVYAAYLSYTDYEVGRIVNYLKQIGQFDNTLIFLMIGDNGGSKEGTYTGTTGFADKSQGEDIAFQLSQYDKIGTEYSYPNYPLGWSQACNTPFRYWKSDANSEGATHNPLIIHYTNGIGEKNTVRTQYSHIVDILPTTVELAGIKVPDVINGYPQRAFQGISLVYTIKDPQAPTRHRVQYYELHGGRSIYKDGWKAAVYHPRNTFNEKGITDVNFSPAPFDKDKWELYNLNEDWTETRDVAAKYPQKLEELKTLFDSLALAYNVYPLKNYMAGVPPPEIRPRRIIYEGTSIKTRIEIGKGPVKITAAVELPAGSKGGVIFANGGLLGGTSLYLKDGSLYYTLTDGVKETTIASPQTLVPGTNTVEVVFADSGSVSLSVNGVPAGQSKIGKRARYLASVAGEGISVGRDLNSPVTRAYPGTGAFDGRVKSVVVEQNEN